MVFFPGTMLEGPAPLAPLDDFSKFPHVSNPRLGKEVAPNSFYLSFRISLIDSSIRKDVLRVGGRSLGIVGFR